MADAEFRTEKGFGRKGQVQRMLHLPRIYSGLGDYFTHRLKSMCSQVPPGMT